MAKLKFAAVDIGSNASRLLFTNVYERDTEVLFKTAFLIRVPLRLGEDAFSKKVISEEKINRLIKTLKAFKLLIDVHDVVDYRICATSAMREAGNRKKIIDRVKKETGLTLEVVEGKQEAQIIYSNHTAEDLNSKKAYLYIDVGGGSTEITLFKKNKIVGSRSFNIGTIRMLQKQIRKTDLVEMTDWVRELTADTDELSAIGSGGNINKIFSLSRKKEGKPLSYKRLFSIYKFIKSYSLTEREEVLGLNPDRADVIIPAAEIYLSIMDAAGIKEIYVPKIGVSDGIVHQLYERYAKK